MIWLHLTAATLALGLGIANLALAKGTRRHRIIGWTWLVTMSFVTLSSFPIRELNEGTFQLDPPGSRFGRSSAWAVAIIAIRRGWVRTHASFMIGTMVGVIVAGLFALAPGRFISNLLGA